MDNGTVRLDQFLVNMKLADSRNRAQQMILNGYVVVDGNVCTKPSKRVKEDVKIKLVDKLKYVSRAGYKLESLIDEYPIDVLGKVACDIGSSTGGFVDFLLQNGAKKVYAVDVNTKQLHPSLLEDQRVIRVEKNVKELVQSDFQELPDIVTIDVSFISVTKILEAIENILKPTSKVICLIKPQFEVGKVHKGIVRDKSLHMQAIDKVLKAFQEKKFVVEYLTYSKILGSDGNIEFFAVVSRNISLNISLGAFRKVELSDIIDIVNIAWEILS